MLECEELHSTAVALNALQTDVKTALVELKPAYRPNIAGVISA